MIATFTTDSRSPLRRMASRLVRVGVVSMFLLGITSPTAMATDGGTSSVSGIVELGKAPLRGATVSLVTDAPSGLKVSKTTADDNGRFSFTGLASGSDIAYTVVTAYQGAAFASEALTLTAGGTAPVTLTVYPNTVSPAKITTTSWTVWLDFTNGRMAVQQDLTIDNKGTAAYSGTTPIETPTGATTGAVMLPLSPGATNFQYLGRFQSCCSVTAPGAWAHSRPIIPGSSTGTVRYEAPLTSTLTFPAQFPVTAFVLLAPVGSHISSPQLQAAGTESDRGTTYQVFRGGPLTLGQVITISVGAPPRNLGPILWASAGAGIPVVALVSWLLIRRRNRRRNSLPRPVEPPRRPAKSPSHPHPTAGVPSAKAVDPAGLADELARLDMAFESGALADEATYHRIREALLAKLVSAVSADPAGLNH